MSTLALDLPTGTDIPDTGDSFAAALEAAFASIPTTPVAEPSAPVADPTPAEPEAPTGEVVPDPALEATKDPLDDLFSEEPLDMTPQAGHRWKQLKGELKQTRTELEQLRTELAQREARLQEVTGEVAPERVKELEQQLEQFRSRQLVQDLESTEAYREAVTVPLQGLLEQARALADRYGIEEEALMDAFAIDNEAEQEEHLQELLAEANMADRDRARLYRIIEDMNPIFQRRDELAQNAEQALAEARELERQREAATAAERARERSHVTSLVTQRIREKIPFLSGLEGVDLEAIQRTAAERDPSALPPVDHAYREVVGSLFPALVRNYAALQKDFDAAMEKLAAYQGAEPGAGSGGSLTGAPLEEEMTFEEAMRRRFAGG